MSLFSEKLSYYIKKTRVTLLYLSSVSDLDVSYISKIKKGERLPRKKDLLIPLINALRLSPSEKEDLWNAYKVSFIGEDRFLQYQAVKKFFSSISGTAGEPAVCRFQHKIPGSSVHYGKTDVDHIVKAVIESECSKENGCIQIVAQPDYQFLMEVLSSISLGCPQTEITQLICLQTGSEADKLAYNVESLRSMYPLLSCSDSYRVKYYYDDIPAHINRMNVMPFFILTTDCTVSLSADYTLADVSSNPKRHKLYTSIFEQMFSCTDDLIFHEYKVNMIPGSKKSVSNKASFAELSASPFLLPYYSEEALTEMVRKDIPDFSSVVDSILSYAEKMRYIMQNSSNFLSFFTEKGLTNFLDNGYLFGFCEELFYPMKKEDTISALKKFSSKQELNHHTPLLLKPGCMTLSSSFRIFSDSGSNTVFFLTEKPFSLAEQSLAVSIKDFLKYIVHSDEVYSAADTVKFIHKQILSLERQ
ncbi:helix-turn-helix domain-containing protein [Anaerostipes sp.]|uniref:helix-turn-helix domain-containing protein n=1 Tax=Anaerostipes sp. TaxID=1872530 RepID=UPI0025C0DBBB|nr:helix-turn-helix transcriptional regulator [Anaerostipes sp.]MBS7009178.1 helix-turn-helix transcriptional regulator [Anaerostipes sp.]